MGRRVRLATWKDRTIAWIIDYSLLGIIFVPLYLAVISYKNPESGVFITFVSLITPFVYFVVLEYTTGQTIGKKALSLRVIDVRGSKPSLQGILLGTFGKAFLLPLDVGIGLINSLLSDIDRRQRICAMWGDTLVIKIKNSNDITPETLTKFNKPYDIPKYRPKQSPTSMPSPKPEPQKTEKSKPPSESKADKPENRAVLHDFEQLLPQNNEPETDTKSTNIHHWNLFPNESFESKKHKIHRAIKLCKENSLGSKAKIRRLEMKIDKWGIENERDIDALMSDYAYLLDLIAKSTKSMIKDSDDYS